MVSKASLARGLDTRRTSIGKTKSAILRIASSFSTVARVALVKLLNDRIEIPWGTRINAGCRFLAADGGRIVIGKDVFIGAHTVFEAKGGSILIGPRTFVGHGSTIVAKDSIRIGGDVLISEYVTIRDQDHRIDCVELIRESGFDVSEIHIGDDVWIGANASVLRGSRIGTGAVVGAHSLVKTDIPDRAVAVGTPVRIVKYRPSADTARSVRSVSK